MKTLLSIVVGNLFLIVSSSHAGTFTNLAVQNYCCSDRVFVELEVAANQKARVVKLSPSVVAPDFEFVEQLEPPGELIRVTYSNSFTNLVFYGPCTVEFAILVGPAVPPVSGIATMEVLPANSDSTVPVTSVPSTAVAIPADNGGPVTICLESSVDLITWNSALPGTYGTSTTNRFFRVRAIRN